MEVENPPPWLVQTPWHIPASNQDVKIQAAISHEKLNTFTAVLLRSEGVDATGLHFQEAVSPVGPGHAEIVDGSPKDLEGLSLQGEPGCICAQAHLPAHSAVPRRHAGGRAVAFVCHTCKIQHCALIDHMLYADLWRLC